MHDDFIHVKNIFASFACAYRQVDSYRTLSLVPDTSVADIYILAFVSNLTYSHMMLVTRCMHGPNITDHGCFLPYNYVIFAVKKK